MIDVQTTYVQNVLKSGMCSDIVSFKLFKADYFKFHLDLNVNFMSTSLCINFMSKLKCKLCERLPTVLKYFVYMSTQSNDGVHNRNDDKLFILINLYVLMCQRVVFRSQIYLGTKETTLWQEKLAKRYINSIDYSTVCFRCDISRNFGR